MEYLDNTRGLTKLSQQENKIPKEGKELEQILENSLSCTCQFPSSQCKNHKVVHRIRTNEIYTNVFAVSMYETIIPMSVITEIEKQGYTLIKFDMLRSVLFFRRDQ
jgi:hypothetical protein